MAEPRVSNVTNAELRTVRDAMRDLNRMVEALAGGQADKFVLTHRNQMRAVVVSLDRYSQLEQAATRTGT
jgi:hypothetical protein